jgi:hypothetical protein
LADEKDAVFWKASANTRLNEWVFGGATRGLLRNSDICCLLCN